MERLPLVEHDRAVDREVRKKLEQQIREPNGSVYRGRNKPPFVPLDVFLHMQKSIGSFFSSDCLPHKQ